MLIGRSTPSHVLHLVLTIFLCGFWIFPWFLISLTSGTWRCQTCGGTRLSGKPAGYATAILGGATALAVVIFMMWLFFALQSSREIPVHPDQRQDKPAAAKPNRATKPGTAKPGKPVEPASAKEPEYARPYGDDDDAAASKAGKK